MARRVFFSFDFEHDVFRANRVRNCNVVMGAERAGFFDHSEYEEAKRKGDQAIAAMILRHLRNTTVTVVLIGTRTAYRQWVQWEIAQSIKRNNGLLGVRIDHLSGPPVLRWLTGRREWIPSSPGPTPVVPPGVVFPVYDWDDDADRFCKAIEAAGLRGDELRRRREAAIRALLPPPVRPLPPGLASLYGGVDPKPAPDFFGILQQYMREKKFKP